MLGDQRLELVCYGPRTVVRFIKRRPVRRDEIKELAREWTYMADRIDCQTFVLDCSELEIIRSEMLSKLVLLRQRLKRKGAALVLCGIRGGVREVLNWVKLDRFFAIREDESSEARAVA